MCRPAAIAVLAQINALPCAKGEGAVDNGNVQRNAGKCRLHMRRHIIATFDIVHPGHIGGRQPIERGYEVSSHIGIRVFLNQE